MSINNQPNKFMETVKPKDGYFNQLMANTNANRAISPRKQTRFADTADIYPSDPRTFLPSSSKEPVLSGEPRKDPRFDPGYNAKIIADVDRLSNQKDILDTIAKTRLSNTNKNIENVVSSEPAPEPAPEPALPDASNLTNTNKKGEEKIPNSLIIYIKTRIPNFYKMTYEPFMTVPQSKSHTVYFDPLIKYYDWPVRDLPNYAPKNSIYSQFFEASEFDTMVNRILSDFRYMQKPRTLEQSFEQGIIDNNINITLNTLFRTNNLFYINKKPYTIVNKRWTTGAWDIDKKPIQKLLSQFSHLTAKQLEEQAKEEEDEIPEAIRQGNVASGSLAKKSAAAYVTAGLADAAEKKATETTVPAKKSFLTELNEANTFIKKLFTVYLQDNPPINYSNTADLATDPLTLSLLIDPAQLAAFIEANPESNIIDLYQNYMTCKEKLLAAENDFKEIVNKVAKHKRKFEYSFIKIHEKLTSSIMSKEQKNALIKSIILSKHKYIKLLFNLSDQINSIYELQKTYFESLKLLLEEFKKQYASIINYPGIPELALKCIDFDINTVNAFLREDPENKYSVFYFQNLSKFNGFYKDDLYANEETMLNLEINYAEEIEKYIANKQLLELEQYQLEIYIFRILSFYTNNQLDIWVLLFKSLQSFSTFIKTEVGIIVNSTNEILDNYHQTYPTSMENFIQKFKVDGIRSEPVKKKSQTLHWYTVKKDGTKCLIKTKPDLEQEQAYISTLKSSVNAYDGLILYIYLLEIICLRQHKLYVAEENVNHLHFEDALTLEDYYRIVQTIDIKDIPSSIFWDIYNPDEHQKLILINNKSALIYKERLRSIQLSRQQLDEACEKIHDAILPAVSITETYKYCNTILDVNVPDIPAYTIRTSELLELDINNYDLRTTQDFILNMTSVIKDAYYDWIIDSIEPTYYLDWMVYKNDGQNTIDSLLASISYALNQQLDLDENDTTNEYADLISDTRVFNKEEKVEVNYKGRSDVWLPAKIVRVKGNNLYDIKYDNGEIDTQVPKTRIRIKDDPVFPTIGKKRFTVASLKRLLTDHSRNNNNNDIDDVMQTLQTNLEIKFIVFEMFTRTDPLTIRVGDMVSYNEKQYRVVSINENDYILFDGKTEITVPVDNLPGIKLSSKNIDTDFRIQCYPEIMRQSYDIFMYLVATKDTRTQEVKYELVSNSTNPLKYIFIAQDIPTYIRYFIYNNCKRFDERSAGFNSLLLNDIAEKVNEMKDADINEELNKIEAEINKKLDDLQQFTDADFQLNANDEMEKHILESDIDYLEQKREILLNSSGSRKPYEKLKLTGGARDKYQEYSNPYPYPSYNQNPYYNQNPSYNQNLYYNQNPSYNQNPYYSPENPYGYNYPPPPYPYNPYNPYANQSYKLESNKAKDAKSKLAFYIEIELELFPGKSATMFQKSTVRCQSVFERIRESYAEIFGYQYRPATFTEAYAYQANNNNNNNNYNNNYNNNTKRHFKKKHSKSKTLKKRYH